MDKIERIRKEIERLKEELRKPDSAAYSESYIIGANHTLNTISDFLDILEEEPVSEGLEKAAEQDVCEVVNTCSAIGIPNDHIPSWVQDAMINEFIHGAKWQKAKDQETIELAEDHAMLAGMEKMREEMMKDAVDGYVIEDIEEGNGDFLLSADYLPASMGLKDRQKVKVIVLKYE